MAKKFSGFLKILMAPVLLFTVFTLAAPGFGFHSLPVIVSQSLIPTIVGFAMTFSMTTGLFELSAGTQIVFNAIIGAQIGAVFGTPGMIIGALAVGVIMGSLMGGIYTLLRIPSMVVSMGMVMILEIICIKITGQGYVTILPEVGAFFKFPNTLIIFIGVAAVFHVLYYYTKFSFDAKTIGNNELLAKTMGVNVKLTKFKTYAVGGLFFGIAGILELCYANSISVSNNLSTLALCFKPMMGVMLGLSFKSFFDNMVVNIFVGELSIAMIFTGLIAMGVPSAMQNVVLGFFMLVVMSITSNRKYFMEWRRKRAARKLLTTQASA